VRQLANRFGVPRAQIALAWLLQKQPVDAPIVGATAVGALSVSLSIDDVAWLEEPYVPHPVVGPE
jgi:aryl-alcohol dehydrogenase-like predicted oxidoreductase